MNLISRCIERWKDRRAKKYETALLLDKVRLQDVPLSLLRDPRRCEILYTMAFRTDMALSRQRFLDDLNFLRWEIMLVSDPELKKRMEYLFRLEEESIDLCRK